MAVTWDVTGVKNYDVLTTMIMSDGRREWHPITQALVWATIHVGINEITAKNWREFYARLHIWERSLSPLMYYADNKNHYMTPVEVYMHIGLRTNASNKTRSQFMTTVFDIIEREQEQVINSGVSLYDDNNLGVINEADWQAINRTLDAYTTDEKIAKLHAAFD